MPRDFIAEWKWDGIRVQAVTGASARRAVTRLYSRTGEDITAAFPDLLPALRSATARSTANCWCCATAACRASTSCSSGSTARPSTPKLIGGLSRSHLRAYDLLVEGGEDLRALPFAERRARLEALRRRARDAAHRPLAARRRSTTGQTLAAARADPAAPAPARTRRRRRRDAEAPRRRSTCPAARRAVVQVEARSAHHRRGADVCAARPRQALVAIYSDYTFGVWTRGDDGDAAGAGRQGLFRLHRRGAAADRPLRPRTTPSSASARCARSCTSRDQGLVLEVAFEGLQRSTRHKSGVAMRFPRISRIRWDKPPREADRLETLEADAGGLSTPTYSLFANRHRHFRTSRRSSRYRAPSRNAPLPGQIPRGPDLTI